MREAHQFEKTTENHKERVVETFSLNETNIHIVMTKHGHYRVLENKKLQLENYAKRILSIGAGELQQHFNEAKKRYPLKERKDVSWEKQIDYTLAVFDPEYKMTTILGLHPHLERITIVTIIPKVQDVYLEVNGAYRIDTKKTIGTRIFYNFAKKTRIKEVRLF